MFTDKLSQQQRLFQLSLNPRDCFDYSDKSILLSEERVEVLHVALMLIILQQYC